MSRSGIISIPIRDEEVIEISAEDLLEGADVLSILRDESVKLNVWIDVAVDVYKLGKLDLFVQILEFAGRDANLEYQGYEKDQVRALDTLAAHYVRQGHRARNNQQRRKEMYNKATLLYTTADRILMYDMSHLLGRAYFCMLEGNKMDQADQQFTFVMQGAAESASIPALLGKACISFQKKDYTQALFFYRKALRLKPDCPANVRVGLGHCFAKLGKMDLARLAFERAVELDNTCVPALAALAVLDLNTLTEDGIRTAVQSLSRAYQMESENPIVLNQLANHFFYKQELAKVEQLALHGYQNADNDPVRAEGCYQLARSLHYNGYYDKAFRYYYQASQLATPSFILPFYGLGQMYIQRKEYTLAMGAFEKILSLHPNNLETLKVLGSLYAHVDEDEKKINDYRAKARVHLSKYLESQPEDIEVLLDMAQLLEQTDSAKSFTLYEKVCDLLIADDMDVPPEITNNMGSLAMQQHQYEKAREYFQEALDKLAEENSEDVETFRVTILWNLARANELLCQIDVAEALYKDVLRKDAHYLDSFSRLGILNRDRGNIFEASVWFKEAISVNQVHADAWTLIGLLHMTNNEWQPAQKKFEHILKLPQYKDDAYSHVALGNIWLETLFQANRNREKDKIHQDRALNMYLKALKAQPKNMWAANGIGCILAVRGCTQEAREIFSQVREATADFLDVWLNIAHVYMEQRQYVSAVQMYQNAMKKFNKDNDPTILMYLARAYFRTNKLPECREALERASVEQPENLLIRFNHAIVLQKLATETMKGEKASFDAVEGAVRDLTTAERIFRYMMSLRDEARVVGISYTFTEQQAQACSDLLKQAHVYLNDARKKDEEEKLKKAKQEQERAALRRMKEEQEMEKEEQKRQQLEDLKQTRHLYMQMTKDILRLPDVKDEERKSRGGGGRGRKREDGEEFMNDSSDLGDWEGAGGDGEQRERRKKEGKSKKRRDKSARGGGSDDEEGGGERRRKKDRRRDSPKLSAKQSAKIKSRAFISDDDDSDDAANTSAPMAKQLNAAATPPRPSSDSSSSALSDDSDGDAPSSSRRKPTKSSRGKKLPAAASDSEDGLGGESSGSERPTRTKKPTMKKAALSSDESEQDERSPQRSEEDEAPPVRHAPRKMSSSEEESD